MTNISNLAMAVLKYNFDSHIYTYTTFCQSFFPICPRVRANILSDTLGHFMTNCMMVMQCIVHRLHKPISGVCHDPHQNISGYIGTHKETNRGNGLAWVSLQIASYWNEALRKIFSQKRHLPDDIQNSVKKNSKMF